MVLLMVFIFNSALVMGVKAENFYISNNVVLFCLIIYLQILVMFAINELWEEKPDESTEAIVRFMRYQLTGDADDSAYDSLASVASYR
ncbi:unnamed protein product [Auanema sp. JU1783]|nr:unnamed protein product [Auanema sp. JU1783]